MNGLINNVQIIKQGGKPAFAVIPYDDFVKLTGTEQKNEEPTIPHVVVGLVIKNNWPLVKAWRKYLKMSQKSLAAKAGISQPALSQMENSNNLRSSTLDKLAKAMDIAPEQLID
jgi:DNA-binding Xre family transcriptional regulator